VPMESCGGGDVAGMPSTTSGGGRLGGWGDGGGGPGGSGAGGDELGGGGNCGGGGPGEGGAGLGGAGLGSGHWIAGGGEGATAEGSMTGRSVGGDPGGGRAVAVFVWVTETAGGDNNKDGGDGCGGAGLGGGGRPTGGGCEGGGGCRRTFCAGGGGRGGGRGGGDGGRGGDGGLGGGGDGGGDGGGLGGGAGGRTPENQDEGTVWDADPGYETLRMTPADPPACSATQLLSDISVCITTRVTAFQRFNQCPEGVILARVYRHEMHGHMPQLERDSGSRKPAGTQQCRPIHWPAYEFRTPFLLQVSS